MHDASPCMTHPSRVDWAWDWADTIVKVNATNATAGALLWGVGAAGPQSKRNSRFIGMNLLAELDASNEYHISKAGLLHWLPPTPPAQWSSPWVD